MYEKMFNFTPKRNSNQNYDTIFFPCQMSKNKTADRVDKGTGTRELLYTVAGNPNWCNSFKDQFWYYLPNKNANSTYRNFSKRETHTCV